VGAREQVSGVEAQIDVKPSYGLSDDQIARMLQESFSTAQVDMRARALVEARVDAQRLVLATQSALIADGDLLDANERADVDAAIAALLISAQGEDAAQIEASSAQAMRRWNFMRCLRLFAQREERAARIFVWSRSLAPRRAHVLRAIAATAQGRIRPHLSLPDGRQQRRAGRAATSATPAANNSSSSPNSSSGSQQQQ
jgi:hypothetical protein